MSFNSVTLIIAGIIFVVLLAFTAYFIYQDQKSKFTMIQTTCPDYWKISSTPDASGNYYCSQIGGKNIGSCNPDGSPPTRPSQYTILNSDDPCTNYNNKISWVNSQCGKKILWDGVTNNPDLKNKCKITV
jgi:hypothetical protein